MKVLKKGQTLITIKRPNGNIEVVDIYDNFGAINDATFKKIKDSTERAKKGEVLKYENIASVIEFSDNEKEQIGYEKSRENTLRALNM